MATLKGFRPLRTIAAEISSDWVRPHYGAVPYIAAMATLTTMSDTYGMDDAPGIVAYFLTNARTWKGDVARRVKTELKAMLKSEGIIA